MSFTTVPSPTYSRTTQLSAEVQQFLSWEAALLDEWRLEEWLDLFEEGATYHVPATDAPDSDPRRDQFLVADSFSQIQARVHRLESKNAHAERPRSRTRRHVTNVLVRRVDGDEVDISASFAVHRFRGGDMATYVGQYRHVLVMGAEGLRFRRRIAVLDHVTLSEEGRISVIL